MRLIDADKLLKEIDEAGNEVSKHIGETGNANFDRGFMYGLAKIFVNIERQPTAYDVDKVVAQLEALDNVEVDYYSSNDVIDRIDAIEIVVEGGIDV